MTEQNDVTFLNYLNLIISDRDVKKRVDRVCRNAEVSHTYHRYKIKLKDDSEMFIINDPLGYRFICSPDFYDNDDTSDSLLTYDRICYYLSKLGEKICPI